MLTKTFIAAIFFLLIGVALQFVIGGIFGIWINFVFAALVASAFFFGPARLLPLVLLAVFLLNWQPAFSWELAFVAAFPFLALKSREKFQWREEISAAFFIAVGIAAMYIIFAPRVLVSETQLFVADILGALILGIISVKGMKLT